MEYKGCGIAWLYRKHRYWFSHINGEKWYKVHRKKISMIRVKNNITCGWWKICCILLAVTHLPLNKMAAISQAMFSDASRGDEIKCSLRYSLTLNVRGVIAGLTRSISWLLMPWLLASPGHHHPWYWHHKMGSFLSSLRYNFNYLCHISTEEW